ncbi:MAG: hypothetical protein DRG78_03015 [Epsilonproteobacteria bacterium]|nr:MAG: hypothetical protein DRG78_03015 [Campylobacterota bacterium]
MLNILHVAQTGLNASQTQVENVMNNLANETTEGYKKRVVNVSELEHADGRMTGRGISLDGVSRITNNYAYQNLIKEEAKLNDLTELNVMLNDIESIFFETDTAGLSADLNRYFQSIENLRTSPDNAIYKSNLTNNANILVDDLQSLYSDIEERESITLGKVEDTVVEINSILNSIGSISKQIQDSAGGNTPNDLLDKRDALEKELAKYIDVEISRDDTYELKIGGTMAVRFATNVHALDLVEEYTPQQDAYVEDRVLPYSSNIVDTATWGTAAPILPALQASSNIAEVQTLEITGTATDQVYFLGSAVDSSATGDDATTTATNIAADEANGGTIISAWNTANPDKEIDTITSSGATLTITYKASEEDVSNMDETSSRGIEFATSVETTQGTGEDSLTYTLNNEYAITVTNGETLLDAAGNPVDLNGDSVIDATDNVNNSNVIQALVYKINQDNDIGGTITAYNGKYELAEDGTKILTSNPLHTKYTNPETDHYLFIESTIDGEAGKFVGEVVVNDNNNTDTDALSDTFGEYIGKNVSVDTRLSKEAINDIHLEIFGKEVNISGGILNPMINNIKTDSGNNDFNIYKEKLDQLAQKLSDYSSGYIETSKDVYIYGVDDSEIDANSDAMVDVGLFGGADVKSLKFNDNIVNTLTQDKLDYLATIQWKSDVDFDSTGQNNTSFSKFYQTIRFDIADNRENIIIREESQKAVTQSLSSTYDQLTKVDKDEEMINLIKFQSAYEANAKVITVIDEMLSTLLNMKR